ncbi:MAG: lipopolysaccharide biosynthesis protein [Gemmatimonadaceae bacterium]|nr:lipopolysaccharide biosynthesis protein [Gemmatimonadaceae bacterium]
MTLPPVAPEPSPPIEPALSNKLDGALVRGIAWTGGVKWLSQVASWGSTLIVARLLTPEDYGLVGMASVYLGLVTMLSAFGIGAAVVRLRTLTEDQIAQINTLSVAFGLAAFVISCIAAGPLAVFFDAPQLRAVVLAMSATFVITSFKTVPQSLLQRDLLFKRLAFVDGVQALILAATTIGFAVLGFRYWTLVFGAVLSALMSTALMIYLRPHPFARPRVASVSEALKFSGHIVSQRLTWYVYSNADFMVAGKILGKAALGAYSLAWTLANVPIEKVTALVVRVTPAIFSSVQDDHVALTRYLLALTEGLALLTFPTTFGLALMADGVVLLMLGEKWRVMILPLQLLASYASVRSITPLFAQVLNVTGDAGFGARNSLIAAIVLPISFYIGSRWGTAGIAAAWLFAHPTVIVPLYWRVLTRLKLSIWAYLRALVPALSGSLLMALAVLLLRSVSEGMPLLARVLVPVVGGAATYVLVIMTVHRDRMRSFVKILRAARS